MTGPASGRPKRLAAPAGPSKRINSPRQASAQKFSSARAKGAVSANRAAVPTQRKGAAQAGARQSAQPVQQAVNGKLLVDRVLTQLSCANEKVLSDVLPSVARAKGGRTTTGSRGVGAPVALRRKQPDVLLESFNSVAFKEQLQKGKQGSATLRGNATRPRQVTPIKKVDKTNSPRNDHHLRLSDFGPCKCQSCKRKRNEVGSARGTANSSSPSASLVRNGAPRQSSAAKPPSKLAPKKPELKKAVSLPLNKPVESGKSNKPNSATSGEYMNTTNKKPTSASASDNENDQRDVSTSRKPFVSLIQSLFKTSPVEEKRVDVTKKTKEEIREADSVKIPQATEPGSDTYDIKKLSIIEEEKCASNEDKLAATASRHSSRFSASVSLDPNDDGSDSASILSYPFPRPRSASTCCQSFQFMEVATGWLPNGDAKRDKLIDIEPFGIFDGMDGVSVAGNFINLKEDAAKSRKIIKSRLGVKSENKPEAVIQWKRGPVLGRGAFGTVWCGLTMAGEMIAVKQAEVSSIDMQKAQKEYEKIQEEIDLLKCLSHKSIVGYLGTSLEDRVVSIFMQFIPGGSIASILKKFGPLAEPVIACYTKQILEGVDYLHSKNVVHRDIKGSNVMLMPNAAIKLIDFGCAKRAMNLTKSNQEILKSMKGTPYWMAPEVMNETGHGKKSDIWSVGCTMFEMATSRPPWAHLNRYAALFTISNATAPLPQLHDKFSPEGKSFVADCMTRNPDKRPDAAKLLNSRFIIQYCQDHGRRILDSRGAPLNSSKRQ